MLKSVGFLVGFGAVNDVSGDNIAEFSRKLGLYVFKQLVQLEVLGWEQERFCGAAGLEWSV